jgi:hypothetical protein
MSLSCDLPRRRVVFSLFRRHGGLSLHWISGLFSPIELSDFEAFQCSIKHVIWTPAQFENFPKYQRNVSHIKVINWLNVALSGVSQGRCSFPIERWRSAPFLTSEAIQSFLFLHRSSLMPLWARKMDSNISTNLGSGSTKLRAIWQDLAPLR